MEIPIMPPLDVPIWANERPFETFCMTGQEIARLVEDAVEAKEFDLCDREWTLQNRAVEIADFESSFKSLSVLRGDEFLDHNDIDFIDPRAFYGKKKAKKAPKGWNHA